MNVLNIPFLFLLSLSSMVYGMRLYAHFSGHYDFASRHPQSRERPRPERGSAATRRQLCLSIKRFYHCPDLTLFIFHLASKAYIEAYGQPVRRQLCSQYGLSAAKIYAFKYHRARLLR